jgi:hypothetical protein
MGRGMLLRSALGEMTEAHLHRSDVSKKVSDSQLLQVAQI